MASPNTLNEKYSSWLVVTRTTETLSDITKRKKNFLSLVNGQEIRDQFLSSWYQNDTVGGSSVNLKAPQNERLINNVDSNMTSLISVS